MKVSIITATYNSEGWIASALRSIYEQDYKDIELLIIDGKSKDNTLKVVKSSLKNKADFKVISEKDEGLYDALNKGILQASGDIIGFVHSDDFLASPEVLSDIVKTFQENPVNGVFGDLLYIDKKETSKIRRNWKGNDFTPGLLKKGWMPAHPTLFLKKEVYEKHGYFDIKYKIAADYDFMLRILKDPELKFHYLPKLIIKMRIGGISNGSIKGIIRKSWEDFKALKKNKIKYPLTVLIFKNLRKLPQFFSYF